MGVTARRLTAGDIAACPKFSLSVSHYRDDGTCQCKEVGVGLVVAMLWDHSFEEPPMLVWGDTEDEVLGAVKAYLLATRPHRGAPWNERMSESLIGELTGLREVEDTLEDCEELDLQWFSSAPDQGDGWLRRAATVEDWIRANHLGLHRAHTPSRPVEDVVLQQDHL